VFKVTALRDMDYRVYVTRRIPEAGLDILRRECKDVRVNPTNRSLSRQELLASVSGIDGLLCMLNDLIDATLMEATPDLKGISNYAVGYNNVDVAEATGRGIAVSNTPGVLTDATADLAWALMMAVTRRIAEGDLFVRRGDFKGWAPMLLLGGDIVGRTLGVVGAGRIGTSMALRSKGFNMDVLYCSLETNEILEEELAARRVDKDTLLRESDFVSLHVPLTDDTRHLISVRELGMMKRTAFLINTSRGPVVDEAALVEALRAGQIAGAALDVFENEPEVHPGLIGFSNVVMAPHLGSATVETRTKMAVMAAENLVAMLKGVRPGNCVNPEVFG
jgi:lactate dehydrogenase-like 2-hydroxyacid dehydrogenase